MTALIIVLVGGGVLAGVGAMLYRWWTTMRVPWRPLQGMSSVRWYSPVPFDETHLSAAVLKASMLLFKVWPPAEVAKAVERAGIYVRREAKWPNKAGELVNGEQSGTWAYIGCTLEGLCHELAHLCDELIDGRIDLQHVTWEARGIRAAEAAYEAWLRGAT